MQRNTLSVVLLIVVVFAALRFLDSPPEQFQSAPEPEAEKSLLTRYINSVETLQFGEDGSRQHHFTATRVNHRATKTEEINEPGEAELIKPNITLFDNGDPQWHLYAEFGTSQLDNELIYLNENVEVEQLSNIDSWTINTNSLLINPNTKIASTEEKIELRSAGIFIEGLGMRASFNEEKLELLANTKTRYETQD